MHQKTRKQNLIMLNIGDKIPEVFGMNEAGAEVTRAQFSGQKLVIYFYPKDNTSGCTAQACSLRDDYHELAALGYNVIGVSSNSAASHQKFIEKNNLPFTLIADTDLNLHQLFGTWGEKSMCGRKYMGTIRATFIFDEFGILTEIIEKVENAIGKDFDKIEFENFNPLFILKINNSIDCLKTSIFF